MQQLRNIRFDVASAISKGQRPYQEDALVTDFPLGTDVGFAVLADGMGGHAAGDVASKIVVTEVYSELKLQSGDLENFSANLPGILRAAALAANDCVKGHVDSHAETAGMGATLVAPVLLRNQLYWISVGDSPLLLFRDGELTQLNEDHSMAPQIDFMIRSGMMSEDIGRNHPDRSCLTSVLGGDHIPRIDCPAEPLALRDGDVVIVASDGLQYLSDEEIIEILARNEAEGSSAVVSNILSTLEENSDPEQDNASFTVIKIRCPEAKAQRGKSVRKGAAAAFSALMNRGEVAAAGSTARVRSGLLNRGAALFRSSAQ